MVADNKGFSGSGVRTEDGVIVTVVGDGEVGDEGGVDKPSDVVKISESDKVVSEGDVGDG